MAFVPVPDVVRVNIKATTIAMPWSFGLWFSCPGFDRADMETLLDYIETTLLPGIAPYLDDDTTFGQLVAYDMSAVDGEKVARDISVAGTVADTPALVSTALVISYYGGKRGPWNQGRCYLAGFADNGVSASTIDQVTAGYIHAYFLDMITSPPAPWQWCVVSRVFEGAPRVEGVYAPVMSSTINSYVVGTQKRRLPR
jgi:hypothetical protein